MEVQTTHFDTDAVKLAIIERAAKLLVEDILGRSNGSQTNGARANGARANGARANEVQTNGSTEPKKRRRRRASQNKHTPPSTVPDETIVQLIQTKGPQRVVEIMKATGMTQSSTNKKVANLKASKVLKYVKEGQMVRYALATPRGRKKVKVA